MSGLDQKIMEQAYNSISFSPEKRGEQNFNYYSEMLKEDLGELGENCGNYEAKFVDKVMTHFHRMSRCASAFICGPANFPVRSNQKRWDSAEKALSDFDYWRTKYFKAVNRVRTPSPEEEIDTTLKRLDFLIGQKELNSQLGKIMRSKSEFKSREIHQLMPDLKGLDILDLLNGRSIADFAPVTYNATLKIRESKKKIEAMKVRIERKKSWKPIEISGGTIDIENDRFIVKHDEKPSREVIDIIKSNGFRYSPKFVCWCRKNTGNAAYSVQRLVKELGELR